VKRQGAGPWRFTFQISRRADLAQPASQPVSRLTLRLNSGKVWFVRAVAQRVVRAAVRVDGEVVGEIGSGILALVGVKEGDGPLDAQYIAEKIANLRIFPDESGRMDRSALDVGAGILVVSQFTLYGDARKGRRPSYIEAARGEPAVALYEAVCSHLRDARLTVATGRFGAMMEIDLVASGPVTILMDSGKVF
jgi:D-aminoacyl-tRNA deacylase